MTFDFRFIFVSLGKSAQFQPSVDCELNGQGMIFPEPNLPKLSFGLCSSLIEDLIIPCVSTTKIIEVLSLLSLF